MAILSAFSTPAFIQDLSGDEQQTLNSDWNANIQGFTQQSICGNPWNGTFQSDQTAYYDATQTDIPDGTGSVLVSWTAFPGRIDQYLSSGQSPVNPYNLAEQQLWEIADTGALADTPIPQTLCPLPDWGGTLRPYGPYGPRGWMDEYCEWSVTRDDNGNIVRVDFACENPEYWYTLFRTDPQQAAQIYNQGAPAANQITVTVDDLSLKDPNTGEVITNPETGGPAYNPLNKWNSGPVSLRGSQGSSGGVMHLTATPNTLQTELGLAGSATVQRTSGNSDPQALICCSQYGQNYRHSDPHIGQAVNTVVSRNMIVALADPQGLYIQMPDFTFFQLFDDPNLPANATVNDCWQVIRGAETVIDPVTGSPFPGNMILHAAFQIPQSWIDAGVTHGIQDIQIKDSSGKWQNIQYGAQIAETFQIGLFARPLPQTAPAGLPCVGTPTTVYPQPLQCLYATIWNAMYNTSVPTPVAYPMVLASNSVIIPPAVTVGTNNQFVLTVATLDTSSGDAPAVSFGDDITVEVVNMENVNYAVPGNSYPSTAVALTLNVSIDANAQTGVRGVTVANPGQQPGPAAPAFLNVVALP